jgi:hypothetical protein
MAPPTIRVLQTLVVLIACLRNAMSFAYPPLRARGLFVVRRWVVSPEELEAWTDFAEPAACAALDFSGTWGRDRTAALKPEFNVVGALVARGRHDLVAAKVEADKPYVQRWTRGSQLDWAASTSAALDASPRRKLIYPCGNGAIGEWWVERLPKDGMFAVLFGDGGGELQRRCAYVNEPDADASIAHATLTRAPYGDVDESRRYLKGEKMVLRRTFWAAGRSAVEGAVSTEFFNPFLKSLF